MEAIESVIAEKEETPILNVIQRIKDRTIEPKTLDKETRHGCIEVLVGEGYTQAQIAQILKYSDKTIQRDCKEIRQKNSLTVTPEFVRETIGEMGSRAKMHISRLMQLSRGITGSVMEKAQAELYAWQVMTGYVAKLQSLGCLPQKPQEIISDVFHHQGETDDETSIMQMEEMIDDINLTIKGNKDGRSLEIKKDLKRHKLQLIKAKTLLTIKKIAEEVKESKDHADVSEKHE
jgi:transposase